MNEKNNQAAVSGSPSQTGSGFRPGDVAYISNWNYARRLIIRIDGDVADCLDERGRECQESLRSLETLSQWLNNARRVSQDCDLMMSEVTAYIDAMTAPFDHQLWSKALQDIQNTKITDA